jgi:hypothetical protein
MGPFQCLYLSATDESCQDTIIAVTPGHAQWAFRKVSNARDIAHPWGAKNLRALRRTATDMLPDVAVLQTTNNLPCKITIISEKAQGRWIPVGTYICRPCLPSTFITFQCVSCLNSPHFSVNHCKRHNTAHVRVCKVYC